jgi:hypothetical protein
MHLQFNFKTYKVVTDKLWGKMSKSSVTAENLIPHTMY